MSTPIVRPTAIDAGPFALWKVDHAGIRVPDFDAAIAWYTETLDFRLRKHVSFAGLTFAFLSPAGDDGFVFELLAGPGADSRPPYQDLHASYKTAGWHHVCFRVASVDSAVEQLKHRAVTIVSEPHDVVPMRLRVAFFADPWGNLFEVTESLGDSSAL
jgi:catechol 2,3-dioxygenase-like lactoylglutathione lyase family enzyme